MSKFLRLHNAENNTVVIVNVDTIAVIDSDTYNDRVVSTIYLLKDSDLDSFKVNESPEKIFDMINDNK